MLAAAGGDGCRGGARVGTAIDVGGGGCSGRARFPFCLLRTDRLEAGALHWLGVAGRLV